MSEHPQLQALQRELAIERAARQELEKQTVLKTRTLWMLREQQDKEVQHYQEQLSVLRASLILAHKQQQQQQQHLHSDPYAAVPHPSPDIKQSPVAVLAAALQHDLAAATQDDASPIKQSSAKDQLTDKGSSRPSTVASGKVQDGALISCPAGAEPGPATPTKASCIATQPSHVSSPGHLNQPDQAPPQQWPCMLDTAEQLLAAASKVQQLVEQLSGSELSAAADLSVLQWQLTAIYGRLTCSQGDTAAAATGAAGSSEDSSSSAGLPGLRGGVLQGVACTGSDPLSATCSPATDRRNGAPCSSSQPAAASAAVFVDAATGTSPVREQPEAAASGTQLAGAEAVGSSPSHTGAQASPAQQQQQQQQEQEEDPECRARESRIAAAAQLFSGAANNSTGSRLAAASLSWYYLEPGEPPVVKGPYDAGLMLHWFLKGFLDNALRIAGVVQQASGSSSSPAGARAPPEAVDAFQPLGLLLQQVQAGQGYTPAQPGKEQQASPARIKQQLPVSTSLGDFEPVMHGAAAAAAGAAGSAGGDGVLAKGGGLLNMDAVGSTVAAWLNMAASAQLPGSVSVVDLIEKVLTSVAAPAAAVKGQQ